MVSVVLAKSDLRVCWWTLAHQHTRVDAQEDL